MKRLFEFLLGEKSYMLFLVTIVFYWLLMFVNSEFILTDDIMYNSLSNLLPDGYIEKAISFQDKWAWLGYAIMPIGIFIKFLFISAFLTTGAIFTGHNITFKKIFKTVIICESLFILAGIANTLLLLFSNVNSLIEIQTLNFTRILSVGFLLEKTAPSWLTSSLYTLNFFEMLYFGFLVVCIGAITKEKSTRNSSWILVSYGLYLFIWIVLLTYLNVTYA